MNLIITPKSHKRFNILSKVFACLFLLFFTFNNIPLYAQIFNYESPDYNLEESKKSSLNIPASDEEKTLKGYISKVPSGTKLQIIVESPIDEITSMIDDEFTARIAEDVIIDGNIILPAGSTVTGTISEINPAKKLHKAGSVRINFKNITTQNKTQIPIVASVLTHSGLIKGKLTKKNALISTATIAGPVAAGLGAGLVVDGSTLGATTGAIVGALAGFGLYAFEKGNMVDIKAGDELSIELVEEALVPIESATELQEKKRG